MEKPSHSRMTPVLTSNGKAALEDGVVLSKRANRGKRPSLARTAGPRTLGPRVVPQRVGPHPHPHPGAGPGCSEPAHSRERESAGERARARARARERETRPGSWGGGGRREGREALRESCPMRGVSSVEPRASGSRAQSLPLPRQPIDTARPRPQTGAACRSQSAKLHRDHPESVRS